ncbi:hypothetical protein CPT_Paku_004 [Burkholderia phage Paku]|uniref:Uncharacterized protein n=1 Tax=Burkholderia phage Paku TaxID=2859650 RepID=A0AAE7WMP3_9CAUD|nr:hypothetical protein CPT_Paku_004 [Burkholderia phage Paku]
MTNGDAVGKMRTMLKRSESDESASSTRGRVVSVALMARRKIG